MKAWLPHGVSNVTMFSFDVTQRATCGTRPDKIIFHSRQMQTCPTTYRRDDTPNHPISENSLVNDWSRGLFLRQNRLSFPTRAVLPDNGRRDNTLPPTPFPKTPRQMAVLAISSYFHFFRVSIKIFWGHMPPVPRLVCLCSTQPIFVAFYPQDWFSSRQWLVEQSGGRADAGLCPASSIKTAMQGKQQCDYIPEKIAIRNSRQPAQLPDPPGSS